MAKSKVNYQSSVHRPVYAVKPVKKQYSTAVKQVVDTLAPGMNPRRTKARQVD